MVTLVENLVYQKGLVAEHGLSFYLETGGRKILFDTGQSDGFMKNARVLGIDLSEIDTVVISHGHYDHTGGLYPFLKMNQKAQVYVKQEAFLTKCHNERFIGIQYDKALLDGRITYVSEGTAIEDGVFIMPEIPIRDPQLTHFEHFQIYTPSGSIRDEFQDELYLALVSNQEISIISSCSHRGITNIMEAAFSSFNLPIHMILGGFHIRHSSAEQMEVFIQCLDRFAVRSMGICHCTGVEKYAALQCHFKDRVFYNPTGNEVFVNL